MRLRLMRGGGIAEEHYVGIGAAAKDGEGFAVGGPGEAAAALVGGEFGDVVAGAAFDRLDPDVVNSVFADGVSEEFAVGGEVHAAGNVRIGRDHLVRALGSRIEADERNFLVTSAGDAHRGACFGEDEG